MENIPDQSCINNLDTLYLSPATHVNYAIKCIAQFTPQLNLFYTCSHFQALCSVALALCSGAVALRPSARVVSTLTGSLEVSLKIDS